VKAVVKDDVAHDEEIGGKNAGGGNAGSEVDSFSKCMSSALRILDASAKSVQGLTKALTDKGYSSKDVEKVVEILRNSAVLDDEVLGHALVRRALNKHMGPIGMRADLVKRGIDPNFAQKLVDGARARGEFFDSAQSLVKESLAKTVGLDRKTRLRRLWSAAQRKGHYSADIQEALADAEL
jgi:regulatory protein